MLNFKYNVSQIARSSLQITIRKDRGYVHRHRSAVVLVIEVVCYAVWCVGSCYWGEGVCYATLSGVWAEDSCSHASRVIASWRLGTDKVIRGIEASDGFTAGNMAATHPQLTGSVANNDTRLLLFMRERKTTRKQIKSNTSYSIPMVQNYLHFQRFLTFVIHNCWSTLKIRRIRLLLEIPV